MFLRRAAESTALALVLFLVPVLAPPVSAATWYIQADGLGDAPTIQAGINAATDGDTVLVGPGTYHEALDFLGKDIVVTGEMGPAGTVLDGMGTIQYGVQVKASETRAAALAALTIRGFKRGIYIFESEPSILNNVITDNGGMTLYAGIVCGGNGNPGPWSPLIQGNVISNNRSTGTSGGIGTFKKMIPEIVDNVIVGNRAESGDGGGIYIRTESSGTVIRGNRIEDNYAGDHGGGIYVGGLVPVVAEISYNLIRNNVADGIATTGESGGGIWLQETNAWIHHNTIVENRGNGPNATYGGGITVHEPGTPVIERNIVAFTSNGGGIFCHSGVTPIIRDNLAWQNLPVEGVGLCATWWQTDGNVVADPLFCDRANGDFTVGGSSPALSHPAGPLGAYPTPGCNPVVVEAISWGRVKARFGGR